MMNSDRYLRGLAIAGMLLACGVAIVAAETQLDGVLPLADVADDVALHGLAKQIADARALADVLYFSRVAEPLGRDFRAEQQGQVTATTFGWRDLARERYRQVENANTQVGPGVSGKTIGGKQEAVSIYERVLKQLAEERERGKHTGVPSALLALVSPTVAKMRPQTYEGLARAQQGYLLRPSGLASLVYLELALLKQDLGDEDSCRRLVEEAISKLELLRIDFRRDVRLRASLVPWLNFARPEVCILFLAGQNAALGKRPDQAQKYYATIVERAPGSPFAWEALARMSVMPGVDAGEIDRLKGVLLDTYPLVWGCPRQELKMEKDEFAKQLPSLLRKVGSEGRAVLSGGGTPSDAPEGMLGGKRTWAVVAIALIAAGAILTIAFWRLTRRRSD